MSYHDRIMNIPARIPGYPLVVPNLDYREGHRDARHAAAELAIQADETIRCMTETLDKIGAMLGVENGDVDGIGAAIEGLRRDAAEMTACRLEMAKARTREQEIESEMLTMQALTCDDMDTIAEAVGIAIDEDDWWDRSRKDDVDRIIAHIKSKALAAGEAE